MTIVGCQLDYIWDGLKSRNGGHTCERFSCLILVQTFEVGRHIFDPDLKARRYRPLIQILRQENARL